MLRCCLSVNMKLFGFQIPIFLFSPSVWLLFFLLWEKRKKVSTFFLIFSFLKQRRCIKWRVDVKKANRQSQCKIQIKKSFSALGEDVPQEITVFFFFQHYSSSLWQRLDETESSRATMSDASLSMAIILLYEQFMWQ